ncbi:hypothetical protein B0H34DRAFT_694543 [Crassisporium funariophilum]|nr:hypothetical protein B0H34DRAFT_694543 [Crassisporium funariophilum]
MSPARTWALFKLIRVLVYSLSTILSVGWAAIYAVLLIRGWNSYNGDQRAIVIVLLAIYAISAIMLYLMIIVRFRLWLDGVRIALLLLFQVGGTVTFALFNPTLPCDNVGSESTCKEFESVAIYGGWSLSALLLIYAFVLAIMSSIPAPSPRPNPEAALAINLGSEFPAEKKKRDSFSSVGSSYSQSSFIARPYPYTTYRSDGPDARSPTVSNHSQMTHNYYRPGTPGSTYSTAPSSISSIRNSTRQKYNYSNRMPAPVPRVPPTFNQMQLPQMSIPQQAPGEVVQRQGTLMSIDSRRPIRNDGSLYDPRNARLLTPPGLGYNGPVQIVSQPPVSGSTHLAVPRGMSPQANQFSPSRMGTPVTLAWHGPQGHQYPTRSPAGMAVSRLSLDHLLRKICRSITFHLPPCLPCFQLIRVCLQPPTTGAKGKGYMNSGGMVPRRT